MILLSLVQNCCEQFLITLQQKLNIEIETRTEDQKFIFLLRCNGYAPLLMIPFVENCFKHGASKMRGRQWIKLAIAVKGNQLNFTLSNSKPGGQEIPCSKKGIGLSNVQKRLQILYPANHVLKIESDGETYHVFLQVIVEEWETLTSSDNMLPKIEPITI